MKNFIVEVFTGLVFVLGGIFLFEIGGDSLNIISGVIFLVLLLILTFLASYDIWWQEIPLYPTIGAVVVALSFRVVEIFAEASLDFTWVLYSLIPLFVIFIINRIYSKQAFGFGDYFILAILGLILSPWELLISLEISVLSGALVGGIWAVLIGKMKNVKIPLVPFLLFGVLMSLNFAQELLSLFIPGITIQ